MKKKTLTLLLTLFAVSMLHARTLSEVWVSMPDSLTPTLNKNLRLEMVELRDMNVKAEVNNLLGAACVMDTLTEDYAEVTLSTCTKLQLRLLKEQKGDTIICMVKTFSAPAYESEVKFFNTAWQELSSKPLLDGQELSAIAASLIAKPDTMQAESYQKLCLLIEPVLVQATLSATMPEITFTISPAILSSDEEKQIKDILLQRKFKWNGETFKES